MINWFCHMYPYGNLHELNLDWVIDTVKKGEKEIADFIGVNTIKYANPILWNITSQYEANTVVVDGQTGNAYISVKAVPSGVHLSREEYWTQIYNYANVVDGLREQIAYNEGESTTATRPYAIDDLVFVNGVLYRVIAPMIAGDSFVANSNVVQTTINAEIARLHLFIDDEVSAREDADTSLSIALSEESSTRSSADTSLSESINNEATTRSNNDDTLQNNINKIYRTFNGQYISPDLTELGQIELPTGHTTQGSCVVNNYLYVFHHINDNSENMVSKYSFPGLTLIDSISLPNGMHGNGMTYNPNTNKLIICNSWSSGTTNAYAGTLFFIPLDTFNSYTTFDYRGSTSGSISALTITPNGQFSHATVTGTSCILVGANVDDTMCTYGYFFEDYIGGCERQDISSSNRFIYILFTDVAQGSTYGVNYVDVLTIQGDKYGRIYLNKALDELEGITCTDDTNLYITDVNGKVYHIELGNMLVTSAIGNSTGFRDFNGIFGYFVNTQITHNPKITIATLSNGATVQTIIPVPPILITSYMLAYINGAGLITSNKAWCAVTATGGLRIFTTRTFNNTSKNLQVNYNYSNGYWTIVSVIIDGISITVDPTNIDTQLASYINDGIWTGETGLFGFGNKFTLRGYMITGMSLS